MFIYLIMLYIFYITLPFPSAILDRITLRRNYKIRDNLRNRIRPIPPSCPVGNKSDTIRVRHEGDSTFGRILIRDTHSCTNRTRSYIVSRKSDTCPKNRTRNLGIANLKFLFSQGFSNKTMIYTTY